MNTEKNRSDQPAEQRTDSPGEPFVDLTNALADPAEQSRRVHRMNAEIEQIEPDDTGGGYGEGSRRRPASMGELIVPRFHLNWLLAGLEGWLFSRSSRGFLLGMPFVTAGLALIAMIWWLNHSSIEPVLQQFEAQFNQAVKTGDVEKQELCLNGLMQYRPNAPEYRMRLGLFLIEQDRVTDGLDHILKLASDEEGGHVPARMWLVQQSRQEEPYLKLEPEQIEGQLVRVVSLQEDNVDAHQMLAELYVDQKEWELAEKHLQDAALKRPELNLAVAKLRRSLGRKPQSVREYTEKAEVALKNRLSQNRFDARVRIALAETKLMLGKNEEARALLVSGVQSADGPEVRRALSDFDVQSAEQRLAETIVNRDVALQMAAHALQVDPSNARAITLLARLQTLGANVPTEVVASAVELWQQKVQSDDATTLDRSLLSQLLSLNGKPEEAAQVLEPLLTEIPDLRMRYAALLKRAGQLQKSEKILSDLMEETRAEAMERPEDLQAATRHAEVLMLGRRLHEVASFLRKYSAPDDDRRIPDDPNLQHLYGLTCLELYDNSQDDPDTLQDEDPLQLLAEAVQVGTTAGQALDRLVRVALSDAPNADQAARLVDEFRSADDTNGNVLSLLGLYSIQAGKLAEARSYLEQANAQSRGQNIMILNNLAISLVRMKPSDPRRALTFIAQALEISPDHPDLLSTRGEVYVALKRWPEAAADLKKSLEAKPDNAATHELLVEVYTELDEPGQADYHRQRAGELPGS